MLLAMMMIISSSSYAAARDFLSEAELASHKNTIDRVQKYLSSLSTIVADFTQTAPDGTLATGTFYMQRPGMMRWQYNPPTPVLMVADGYKLTYYDYELEQVNYIKLDETVISFLAQDIISFDKNVGIRGVEEKDGVIRVTLAHRDKPDEGELTLEFADKPIQIRNMVVRDATQQTTTVSLNKAKYGVKLDKSLFAFKDPRERRIN